MSSAFVARQPILDRNKEIFGYELLFRDGENNAFPNIDPDQATSRLIADQFFHDSDSILDNRLGFVNFPYKSMINLLPGLLPADKVVIEVLEDCPPTPKLLNAIRSLKSDGYTIALDDFIPTPEWRDFLPYIDIIKFDIQRLPLEKVGNFVYKLSDSKIRFLAERVETHQDFMHAHDLGFHYFQGYFFSKPEVLKTTTISPTQRAVVELCQELAQRPLNYRSIEKHFATDVSLSYKLLRYVNSANIVSQIESLGQAFAFLGEDKLRKLISLVVIASVCEEKSESLHLLSIQRARFCELIAQKTSTAVNQSQAFLVGLLSLLDALFDTTFDNIVGSIPLEEDVELALLGQDNTLRSILDLAIAYENANWVEVSNLNDDLDIIDSDSNDCFEQALIYSSSHR